MFDHVEFYENGKRENLSKLCKIIKDGKLSPYSIESFISALEKGNINKVLDHLNNADFIKQSGNWKRAPELDTEKHWTYQAKDKDETLLLVSVEK